jgi:hypothetical protein
MTMILAPGQPKAAKDAPKPKSQAQPAQELVTAPVGEQ